LTRSTDAFRPAVALTFRRAVAVEDRERELDALDHRRLAGLADVDRLDRHGSGLDTRDAQRSEALLVLQPFGFVGRRDDDVSGSLTGASSSRRRWSRTAEELFAEGREICERAGSWFLAALATSNLGRLAARTGRFGEAQKLLETALAEFEDVNARSFVVETKTRLAERLSSPAARLRRWIGAMTRSGPQPTAAAARSPRRWS
jgi:hypothetical protein